jgi:hypothetical protein
VDSGIGSPEDSRIAATLATKSPMTRFARSVSSVSRIGPFGSVAHMALMQLRVRDNESTIANIGSMAGGAVSDSVMIAGDGLRNSTALSITRFQIYNPVARVKVVFTSSHRLASWAKPHANSLK